MDEIAPPSDWTLGPGTCPRADDDVGETGAYATVPAVGITPAAVKVDIMPLDICGTCCCTGYGNGGTPFITGCIPGDTHRPGGGPLPLGSRYIWDESDIERICWKSGRSGP